MRRALAGVTGCLLTATLALAGCASSGSSSDNGGDAATLLAATADKTAAAKNSRLSLQETVTSAGTKVEITGEGVVEFATKEIRLTAHARSNPSAEIEEIMLGHFLFIRLPENARGELNGKSWVSVDYQKLTGITKSSALDSGFGQDPTAFLSALASVSNEVSNLGTAKVRGVGTTHYRAQVDLEKAAKLRGVQPGALDQYKELAKSTVLPEDVFLDDQGRTRRLSLSLGSKDSSTLPLLEMTLEFFDFGKADTSGISAPPVADTIDAKDVPAFSGSGLGG
jgi:hypothetical protein